MRVEYLVPDVAAPRGPSGISGASGTFGANPLPDASVTSGGAVNVGAGENAFGTLVDAAGALLGRADVAEARFAAHKGGLQEMVVERARADVALQVAVTAAQRTAQALQTLLGMQL